MEVHGNIVLARDQGMMVARLFDPGCVEQSLTWPCVARKEIPEGVLVQLPWNDDACRLLYNCGLNEAVECAPFMFDEHPLVEGRFKPLEHQGLTAAFMTLHPRCYVLSEPRMGKTGSVILACDYMQRHRKIVGGVCIITTYTTVQSVWARSIKETLPDAKVEIVHGKGRAKQLETPADFYITNYDSVRLAEKEFTLAMNDGRIGAIIVDELTHVGNAEAKRSKAITHLCRHAKAHWVVGLTGSPADNPDAVFGMAKCINPGKLPVTTKSGWENRIYFRWGNNPWQKSLTSNAPEIIKGTLVPSVRYKKSEVLDLPPVTEQVRDAPLSKEQAKAITELQTKACTMLKNGEPITAANGGVLLQRVLQIALGIVKDEDGTEHAFPHEERTRVLLEAIAETPRKTVVFSPYIAGCHMLAEECRKAGYTAEVITGAVSGTRRTEILHAFQHEPDPHVLVCHPITVGFGTELSAADTMIFAVPLLLGGFVYTQALERLSSVKQTAKNINIIHILSCQAERKALYHLQQGHSMGRLVASMFEEASRSGGWEK